MELSNLPIHIILWVILIYIFFGGKKKKIEKESTDENLIRVPSLKQIKTQNYVGITDFDKINGKLDKESFEPGSPLKEPLLWDEIPFPWNDVKARFDEVLERSKFNNRKACPDCNLPSEKLVWIKFSSPPSTWKNLCGRSGPLSICPNCKIQVEFVCYLMN